MDMQAFFFVNCRFFLLDRQICLCYARDFLRIFVAVVVSHFYNSVAELSRLKNVTSHFYITVSFLSHCLNNNVTPSHFRNTEGWQIETVRFFILSDFFFCVNRKYFFSYPQNRVDRLVQNCYNKVSGFFKKKSQFSPELEPFTRRLLAVRFMLL